MSLEKALIAFPNPTLPPLDIPALSAMTLCQGHCSKSASLLYSWAQRHLSLLIFPKSSCKNSGPLYLLLYISAIPICKDQFSFLPNSLPEEGLTRCRFRNQIPLFTENIWKNNSTCIQFFRKKNSQCLKSI